MISIRITQTHLKLALLLALVLGICPNTRLYAQSIAPIGETPVPECNCDGRTFLDSLVKTAEHFEDYQFDSHLIFANGNKNNGGSVFFKKTALVKIIVKSNGVKDGSVVVRQPDGSIRASGGPHLRFLKMTLSDNSKLLQLPNGYNAIKSDLLSLLLGVKQMLLAGSVIKVTCKPVLVDRLHQSVHILEVTTGSAPTSLAARLFVDPKTNVPIEWDVFKDGSILSAAFFDNFKANLGLKEDFFKL